LRELNVKTQSFSIARPAITVQNGNRVERSIKRKHVLAEFILPFRSNPIIYDTI